MTLPSSGRLSMGDINVELGRSRTTANTSLAGGSNPTSNSLFGLANSTVNKNAPHAISEFYGYDNNPTVVINVYLVKFPSSIGGSIALFVDNVQVLAFTTSGQLSSYTANVGSTFRAQVEGSFQDKYLSVSRGGSILYTDTAACDEPRNLTSTTFTISAGGPYDVSGEIASCFGPA